ncbi:hypothetical protein ACIPW5_29450 [Streptomyces sp. NPDC090077]|uniref:hypothetical protein n=1 Tax=Streptomyces sp. NPDC090077 TaxID=3365938 RepID=UPI003827558A
METIPSPAEAGVDAATEALTPFGWRTYEQIQVGDHVLGLDPVDKQIRWKKITRVHRRHWNSASDGPLTAWQHRAVKALSAPGQPWLQLNDLGRKLGDDRPHDWATTGALAGRGWVRIVFGGGAPCAFPHASPYSNEFVELLGWIITEGCYPKPRHEGTWNHVQVSQSERVNPEKTQMLRRLAEHFRQEGFTFNEHRQAPTGVVPFYIGVDLGARIRQALPDKQLPPALISSLTATQAQILYQSLILGDGNQHVGGGDYFIQLDQGRIDSFQMLAAMLGFRTAQKTWDALNGVFRTTVYTRDYGTSGSTKPEQQDYVGTVWQISFARPTAWLARRDRTTFWTGAAQPSES